MTKYILQKLLLLSTLSTMNTIFIVYSRESGQQRDTRLGCAGLLVTLSLVQTDPAGQQPTHAAHISRCNLQIANCKI